MLFKCVTASKCQSKIFSLEKKNCFNCSKDGSVAALKVFIINFVAINTKQYNFTK